MADRLLYYVIFVAFVIGTFSQPSLGALFEPCSSDANCTDISGTCRQDNMTCDCNSTTQYDDGTTCFEKIATGSTCPTTVTPSTPCLDLEATCQNVSTGEQTDYRCTCKSGFTESDGACVATDCKSLQHPANGQVATSPDTLYEATATYTCNEGYELSESITRTCLATGSWGGIAPTCSRKDCKSLQHPANGQVATSPNTLYEATATYTCNEGYELSESITRTCLATGSWGGIAPTCSRKDCKSLQHPANGQVATSPNTLYEATATYTCNEGYELSESITRTCLATGSWGGIAPTCSRKDCKSLQHPANGQVATSPDTLYEATATYTCNEGYELSESITRTCLATGSWGGIAPTCSRKDCKSLQHPANGQVATSPNTLYEATATYTCNEGYELSESITRTCLATGSWGGIAPTCSRKDCKSLQHPANGQVATSPDTLYEATATYTCNEGYELSESITRTCLATGSWGGIAPTCSRKDCKSLTNPANGQVATSPDTLYEATATYTCNEGYELSESITRTCLATGSWGGIAPTCSRKDCGSLQHPTNGQVATSPDTLYEAKATYTCNEGYDLSGSSTRTCLATGMWGGNPPTCSIKDCGTPFTPVNGQVSYGLTTYQAKATYTCDVGYIVDGRDSNTITITCESNGKWSVEFLTCSVDAEPLGAACVNPANTNASETDLCNGVNALCRWKTNTIAEFTCQCDTEYYDDNGNNPAGSCKNISDLQVQSITFADISTASMTVSWSPPAGKQNFVDSYMVEWRHYGNSIQSGSSGILRETTYTINDSLTSGRAYTVRVTTRNVVNYTSTLKTTFAEKEQAIEPQKPGAVNAGSSDLNAVDNAISVVWAESVGDVSGYEWRLLGDGNTPLKSGTTASSSANINYNEIKNGYRYNVSITALSQTFDGGQTIRSETRIEEIKTVVTVPSSPQQVQCHMTTDTSITIKWQASLQPNGDLIDYKIDTFELGSNIVLKTNLTGSLALMYEITGLQPGSYYYFDVSTVNENYTSPPARLSPSYCATRANVSDMPNNLIVSEVQSRSLMVSWTKPTNTYGENMGYVVQVRTADSACVMELIRNCTDCTQSLNVSALEIMCPNVSSSDQLSKTSIESDDKQMYNVTGLNPYVNYTITVTAVNAAGRGNVAQVIVQTDEEVPQKPKQVDILDVASKSCYVTWNIDGPRPGDTLWDVIVDAASPVLNKSIGLEGFSQRRQALNDLQEYWNYTVTIKATTSKGSSFSDPVLFTTLQAAPGPVDGFVVKTSPGGSTVQVQWKIPTLLERNSEIARFSLYHNTSSDGNVQEMSLKRNADNDEYLYDVKLNVTPEVVYQFKVYAINVGGEVGEEEDITVEAPAGIPFNSFETIGNKTVILPEAIVPSQTTLKLSIDKGFYEQTSRGRIILTGLIGCAKVKCSGDDEVGKEMTVDEFNLLENWHKASVKGYTKYRITRDTWRDELPQTRRKRQANGNTEDYIVGSETCNATMKDQYCNGPLLPETSYIMHVVICTSGGCLISNEYGPFATLEVPPEDSNLTIIIAVVVSVVVVAAIVIIVVVFVLRRRRGTPKMTRMEPDQAKVAEMVATANIERKRPIRLSEFEDKLSVLHKDSNLLFSAAYDDLRTIAPTHPQEAANREENRLKNRYINILPFDHSRVKLFSNGEEESSDYINANYLPGYKSPREYIGCQGPIPGTIDDFWRMVWEQNVSIVVMLTLCKEGQKVKCEQYWPDETREPKQYGDVVVEMTSASTIQTYVMRIFKLTNGNKTRTVKHFHFLSWLDFQANVKHDIILDFITHVRSHVQPPDKVGPMIVHCSAGVGRTGTYVCLDHLMQFIEEHDFEESIDIFDMVLKLRENRPLMVQTEQQYVFIHDCVKELMDRKRAKEGIYENQGFNMEEDNIYQNEQGPSLYENIQIKTEL